LAQRSFRLLVSLGGVVVVTFVAQRVIPVNATTVVRKNFVRRFFGCNIVTFGSSQADASFAGLGMLLIATGFRPDGILAKDM